MSDPQIPQWTRSLYSQLTTTANAPLPAELQVSGTGHFPCAYPVTEFATASIALASMALAALMIESGVPVPSIDVDRRRASLWFSTSFSPRGWALPPVWDAIAGDYVTADGWIRLHTNAPAHRKVVETVLGHHPDRQSLALVVKKWHKQALEQAIVESAGCAAQMRSPQEWQQHIQGKSVAQEPLFQHAFFSAQPKPDWPVSGQRPLQGIRVLDLTRIIAGPVATRFLAGFGADVLRIDPFGWDEASQEPEVTLGKRCARLNLHNRQDRHTFEQLLREADVIVHGYRAGALQKLGYGTEQRRMLSPGLVDVCLNAYGWSGPWRERRGFDSLVQMSCGIAEQGMRWADSQKPFPLPVQGLDHATGYLMAATVLHGLTQRLRSGQGSETRLSLARTAIELMQCSTADSSNLNPDIGHTVKSDYASTPEHTQWGEGWRLLPPVMLAGTAMTWDFAASTLGSAQAEWRETAVKKSQY
ncbi:MAG: CoA transferase [Ewingella sp.]